MNQSIKDKAIAALTNVSKDIMQITQYIDRQDNIDESNDRIFNVLDISTNAFINTHLALSEVHKIQTTDFHDGKSDKYYTMQPPKKKLKLLDAPTSNEVCSTMQKFLNYTNKTCDSLLNLLKLLDDIEQHSEFIKNLYSTASTAFMRINIVITQIQQTSNTNNKVDEDSEAYAEQQSRNFLDQLYNDSLDSIEDKSEQPDTQNTDKETVDKPNIQELRMEHWLLDNLLYRNDTWERAKFWYAQTIYDKITVKSQTLCHNKILFKKLVNPTKQYFKLNDKCVDVIFKRFQNANILHEVDKSGLQIPLLYKQSQSQHQIYLGEDGFIYSTGLHKDNRVLFLSLYKGKFQQYDVQKIFNQLNRFKRI